MMCMLTLFTPFRLLNSLDLSHSTFQNTHARTTTVTAFLWPTKSMLVLQPSRSTICAVGPELFMAWAETRYWPSGDQDRRRTWVVPPHWEEDIERQRQDVRPVRRHHWAPRSSICTRTTWHSWKPQQHWGGWIFFRMLVFILLVVKMYD